MRKGTFCRCLLRRTGGIHQRFRSARLAIRDPIRQGRASFLSRRPLKRRRCLLARHSVSRRGCCVPLLAQYAPLSQTTVTARRNCAFAPVTVAGTVRSAGARADFPERNLDSASVSGFVHHQYITANSDQDAVEVPTNGAASQTAVIEWSPNLVVFKLKGVVIGTTTTRVPKDVALTP